MGGRPPDWLSSQFTENLVNNKLDILGNVITGEEICPDFKNKLQEIEGFTEDLYKKIVVMLKKSIEYLKKRGVSFDVNIKGKCIFKDFTHYKSKEKIGTKMINIMFEKKTKVLVEKWNKLQIEDLCPINARMLISSLQGVVKTPPRAAQYRIESILGSIRTEKHLCKFLNEGQMRPCHICGKKDTLEHMILFCVNPQIAWTSMVERYEQLTGNSLKLNVHMCLLGRINKGIMYPKIINRLLAITLWWICKTNYERKGLKTSWEIGRELNEMYRLGDSIQLGDNWKSKSLDVEIDSVALKEKITALREDELRKGAGNIILWLRSQNGALREPELVREEGFRSCRKFPNMNENIGNRKIKLSKK